VKAVKRLSPVEALEEALRIVESEPLRAVELASQALRGLKPSFETASFGRALKAHRARLKLEEGEGLEQAVRELKADLEELLARARGSEMPRAAHPSPA
jgi:ribosomal protein S21